MLKQLQGLRSFVSVARWGSVGAAARRLHYDPSTVRSHVRQLERRLRLRLLRRDPADRGDILTPAGQQLAPEAERAVDAVDAVESKAAELSDDAG